MKSFSNLSVALFAASLAVSTACSGTSEEDGGAGTGGSAGGGDSSGAGGSEASGGSSSGGSDGAGTGGDEAGTGGSTEPTGDAADCADSSVEFSDSGADEFVQWFPDETERTATPPAGGAYFFNGYFNLTTYSADLSASLSILIGGNHTTIAPGTYACTDGGGGVNVSGLGIASQQALGSDCRVTLDEEVTDGGRIVGSFWAYFPASDWPVATDGGCVRGRFDVTDAAP